MINRFSALGYSIELLLMVGDPFVIELDPIMPFHRSYPHGDFVLGSIAQGPIRPWLGGADGPS
jgi:hypothetical protein